MNLFNQIAQHLARKSAHEREHGSKSRANGMACIVFGIFLLPIPFIGLPLIGFGLVKLFS